jgi:hypothetical protein
VSVQVKGEMYFAMTSEETRAFKLLDEYARDRHECFVTEMDLNKARSAYTLCFRPISVKRDLPNRYACRYLHFEASEFKSVAQEGVLTASITEKLDKELQAFFVKGGTTRSAITAFLCRTSKLALCPTIPGAITAAVRINQWGEAKMKIPTQAA